MYVRLWGVTFMYDCEVTVQPSGMSFVWALNVRLVFLFVSVKISLTWISCFLALVFGVGNAAPDLGHPVQLAPGCNGLLSIMFLFPCNTVSAVGDLVATPGGLPTLSGFSAVIRVGWTIVRRFANEVPLRLRPKALSLYKVQLFNCITLLSDRVSGLSCHSLTLIRAAYSCRGLEDGT